MVAITGVLKGSSAERQGIQVGDLLKIGKILSETAIYFTDYDKNNPTVIELVKEYKEYRNRYNYEISKINAEFMNAMSVAFPVLEDED